MTTKKFASKKFAKKPPVDVERYRGADESISRTDAGKLLAKLMRAPYDRVRQRMHRAIHRAAQHAGGGDPARAAPTHGPRPNSGDLPTIDAEHKRLNVGQLGAWATQTWPRHGAAIAAVLQPSYTIEIKFKDQPGSGAITLVPMPQSDADTAQLIADLYRRNAELTAENERLKPFEEKQTNASERKSKSLRGKTRRR